jgi:hypothetical protein
MTREEAHKLVDELFDSKEKQPALTAEDIVTPASAANEPDPKPEPSKDKRAVRTKSSGDRVYLLDETKKTRQWVTNPTVLKNLGFELPDVKEIDDAEMLKYQMAPALYRVENG